MKISRDSGEMNFAGGRLHAGLHWVLDTALDAVVVMDFSGHIVGWNTHSVECFGWSGDEAIGKRLSSLIIPEAMRDAHERGLARYLETGEGPVLNRRIEVSAIHRDGREFPVELTVSASELFGEPLFVGFLRDISERLEAEERQQRILQESEHRVKNMLTVVAAIAQQTARASADLDSFSTAFSGRLQSLARAHELLLGKVWTDVALSALAEQVLGRDVAEGRARFGGPEVLLKARQVLGLSMVLHELYTNAVKYGALSREGGMIELDWRLAGDEIEIAWTEHGATCAAAEPASGFGQRMIAMSVKSDLEGVIERDWRADGLRAVIRFPVES